MLLDYIGKRTLELWVDIIFLEAGTSFAKSKSWSLDHPWSGYPAAFHKASCVTVYRLRTT